MKPREERAARSSFLNFDLSSFRRARIVAAYFAGCVLLLEGACVQLNKSYPEKQFYSLEVARTAATANPGTGHVLRVRRFVVAPQYEGRELVYRTGDLQFESDFYHEWFVQPGAVLTQQTLNWLAASGIFQAVLDSGSRLDETLTLEGHVTALYGDYRDKSAPKAVLELRVRVIGENESRPPILFHQDYRQAITVADETPEALVKGLNEELQLILSLLEEDLRRMKLTANTSAKP